MRITNYCEEKIKEFEGLRLRAYRCAGGVMTIGYGHTGKVNGQPLKVGAVITKEQADELLRRDVESVEAKLVKEPYSRELSESQFDALVSFIFNLGWGAFVGSTLRKKLLRDVNDEAIPDEFRRWVYSNGRVLPGLVTRREWEAQMYEDI